MRHARSKGMDLSSLAELGKVAGGAGIAIGMIVLIARPMIEGTKDLPRAERAPIFRLVGVGAFAIGGLGIVAWLIAAIAAPPSGGSTGNCNITSGGIGSGGNKIKCDLLPSAAAAKP
jgi:hypothetical protein